MSASPESNLQRLLYYQQEKKEKRSQKGLFSIFFKNKKYAMINMLKLLFFLCQEFLKALWYHHSSTMLLMLHVSKRVPKQTIGDLSKQKICGDKLTHTLFFDGE